jgi:hypothetical protein
MANNLLEQSHRKRKMSKEDSKRSSSLFDSSDFLAFLSTENRSNTSMFKSKDSFASLFRSKDSTSDLFKSKDSFSGMFASRDWVMSYAPTKKRSASATSEDLDAPKSFQPTTQEKEQNSKVAAVPVAAVSLFAEETDPALPDVMKSQDWAIHKTLGHHVEVPYGGVFSRESSIAEREDGKLPPDSLPRAETRWEELFMSQLMPPTTSQEAVRSSPDIATHQMNVDPNLVADAQMMAEAQSIADIQLEQADVAVQEQADGVSISHSGTVKKRKRAPRKKIFPNKKVYVEPKPLDILGGRGGRSNHHQGNKRYREEVENLKEWYNNIDSKDDKTELSQCLVDYVQSYGARFLEHDGHGWYIVDNIVARRKASQALREDSDPEKRRAKRQRFLAKRARIQEEAGRQKREDG